MINGLTVKFNINLVGIKNNLNLVVTLCSMSKILLKYEKILPP